MTKGERNKYVEPQRGQLPQAGPRKCAKMTRQENVAYLKIYPTQPAERQTVQTKDNPDLKGHCHARTFMIIARSILK